MNSSDAYRLLPAVDEVLQDPAVAELASETPREVLTAFLREVLVAWRAEIGAGRLDAAGLEQRLAAGDLARELRERVAREGRRGVRRAINAAGVVLHTGLGRAPVHPEVAAAMAEVASGYCILEVDRETGQRNRRDERLSELLVRLTGCEAAIAVNNNAGAVLLVLNTFGQSKEVVVSRGELVEIGGSFRVPSIMERAGARLREVGTTNRTRASDYEEACGPDTGLLLKVHGSNFRIEGFVEEVSVAELVELGRRLSVPNAYDLGSGLLDVDGAEPLQGLGSEPRIREAVEAGIDVVLFSGDKLLGGPQAGILVGRAEVIDALRANPVYRALRLDKVALAGLERTLELYLSGRGDEIPARAMLLRDTDSLRVAAQALASELSGLEGLQVSVCEERSQPGSGSAPGVYLPTHVVRVESPGRSIDALARALRTGEPPVFARIQDGALLLDPRTFLEGDLGALAEALRRLARGAGEESP